MKPAASARPSLGDPRDERPAPRPAPLDFLAIPLLGSFLKWRHSRAILQAPVLILSLIMIGHALAGPRLAPKNLGSLLTWVHFRGLVVLAILLVGNLFCMACPFMFVRDWARKWITPRWNWPRPLRNKWPAISLFVLVLLLYELFDLWSDPWWTGVMIVGYFLAALLVDLLYRRASFCKFVCPIGQFNFLSSTLSPFEVSVRDKGVCASCTTKDCIRGRGESAPTVESPLPILVQRGCELALFQPRKVGNLDCTFCLDCVYACPHDNIGIQARLPAEELAIPGPRSGLGRIERRFDMTALAVVFTFGAMLNAFAMISPVYALEQAIASRTGLRVEWPILASLFAFALVIEPAVLLGLAAVATRRMTGVSESGLAIVNRFARSLAPLGFGVWLAHYGFHFFTGFLTIGPVAQNAIKGLVGFPLLGEPRWHWGGLPESMVFPIEVSFLGLGLAGSLVVAWLIARELAPERAAAGFAPWAVMHVGLFAASLWIMTQPMDMRGVFLGG